MNKATLSALRDEFTKIATADGTRARQQQSDGSMPSFPKPSFAETKAKQWGAVKREATGAAKSVDRAATGFLRGKWNQVKAEAGAQWKNFGGGPDRFPNNTANQQSIKREMLGAKVSDKMSAKELARPFSRADQERITARRAGQKALAAAGSKNRSLRGRNRKLAKQLKSSNRTGIAARALAMR